MLAQEYLQKLHKGLEKINWNDVEEIARVIYTAGKNNKQIFILGNGGSASTASHMACDLGKGTLKNVYSTEQRLRVISLTDNVATLTALSNDVSFDEVFVQQLKNLVNTGDVVIGLSASGNSANVIKALEWAKKHGAVTIGLLGFDGGKLKSIVDHAIVFPEKHYGRSEDCHLIINHIITSYIMHFKQQNSNHISM